MKIDALLGKLRASPAPPVLVLTGDEPWFIDQAIRRVRESFLREDEDGYVDLDAPKGIHDSRGVTLGQALDEVRTVPMFGGRRVVVYRMGTLEDAAAAELSSLARARSPYGRLIVVATSVKASAAKKLTDVERGDSRKLYDTPWAGKPEWDTPLDKWTTAQAREQGMRMTLRTAHVLTGIIGNDLGAIEAALRKLSVNASGREVTEEEIASLVGGGRGFSAFAFGDAIYSGQPAEALRVARHAFHEGVDDGPGPRRRDARSVAARLLWSAAFKLKSVHGACRLLAEGMTVAQAIRALGGEKKPMVQKAVVQAERYDLFTLTAHFVRLARAEEDLRTPVPEPVILETLVLSLVGGGRG